VRVPATLRQPGSTRARSAFQVEAQAQAGSGLGRVSKWMGGPRDAWVAEDYAHERTWTQRQGGASLQRGNRGWGWDEHPGGLPASVEGGSAEGEARPGSGGGQASAERRRGAGAEALPLRRAGFKRRRVGGKQTRGGLQGRLEASGRGTFKAVAGCTFPGSSQMHLPGALGGSEAAGAGGGGGGGGGGRVVGGRMRETKRTGEGWAGEEAEEEDRSREPPAFSPGKTPASNPPAQGPRQPAAQAGSREPWAGGRGAGVEGRPGPPASPFAGREPLCTAAPVGSASDSGKALKRRGTGGHRGPARRCTTGAAGGAAEGASA